MAQPSTTYAPGDPTSTVLYGIVRDHFETFRAQAASLRDGEGLPRFVQVVQRFGGALNLNVHLHALVLDGVFTNGGDGVRSHPVRRLTREDVAEVVADVARRVARLLERRGLAGDTESGEAPDVWSDEAPVLAAAAAASVEGRVALGPRAGARVRRGGDPPEDVTPTRVGPCHAHADGFDLHAGLLVRAGHRDRLERLCRYALRPRLAQERLHLTGEGEIWLALRHRWADGTTHLRFDALEFLERLAVLTPRPRVNLILYYGVLAPRAAWRSALVRGIAGGVATADGESSREPDGDASRLQASSAGAYRWAELMRRTFGIDVLACPRCGGRLRLVALIDRASVIQRILRHLGLSTEVPEPRPARAPPRHLDFTDDPSQDAPEFDAAW